MTLFDLVEEVQEKTHLGELEILDRVQRAWPNHQQFTPTQAALMVRAVQMEREVPIMRNYTIFPAEPTKPQTITEEQLWGSASLLVPAAPQIGLRAQRSR